MFKNFTYCHVFRSSLGPWFRKHFVFSWFSVQMCKNPCFEKFLAQQCNTRWFCHVFLGGRRAKAQWLQGPPEKWMNPPDLHFLLPLGRASSAPPSLSLGLFLKDSQNFLEDSQKFLERFQDILLRLRFSKPRTRWIGGCKFVRHPNTRPVSEKLNVFCWSCSVHSGKLFCYWTCFGCLKNLKRLVVVRVSGVWDRFCVAINTHKVLQVPEHDQQHTNTLDFSDSPDTRPATTHLEFVRHLNHNKTSNKTTLRVQTLETRPAPQNQKVF